VQHCLSLSATTVEIATVAVLSDGSHVARYRPPAPDLTGIVATSAS
jgi:hypothetical protein